MLSKVIKYGIVFMFSFLLGLGFSKGYLGNRELVKKYAPLNGAAAKSIQNTDLNQIIEETRNISPKVSEIHVKVQSALNKQPYSKLKLQSFIVDKLDRANLLPSMAGYKGFPSAVAISVNKELIHNVPDNTKIGPGAIVTVEIGASTEKAYASQTWSFLVPPVNQERSDLLSATKMALENAVTIVKPGVKLGDIGSVIQNTIESRGYSVVPDYCGFGMGKERIMEPQILGYGKPGTGPKIKVGQILNIHVMAIHGNRSTSLHKNGWGVKASTGKNSAALSSMVLITETGYELLTNLPVQ